MSVFELSQEQIDAAGAHWTIREVLQQPDIWREVADLMTGHARRLHAFLAPLLQQPDARIILTGAGTSAFIGQCLAPYLTQRLGRRVEAIATTDIVAGPDSFLVRGTPTLLVSFARSGNSPESMAAVDLADGLLTQCHHLIFTCNGDGALYRDAAARTHSHCVLLPEASNDRSFAMTSSFTGMLLAAALALRPQSAPSCDAELLGLLAAGVLPGFVPQLHALARTAFHRVIYLGSRELKGLAHEAALKMLELTDGRIVAMADSPLGFRHGPKTVLDARTLVVLFLGNDPHARRYDEDLAAELRNDGVAAQVVVLAASPCAAAGDDTLLLTHGLSQTQRERAGLVTDLELCLPYALFAQSLAILHSLRLGLQPDRPNVAGKVSRVVQGVAIHPWSG
jgi:tagatose-6-phosphate ketose/aldose isomerase